MDIEIRQLAVDDVAGAQDWDQFVLGHPEASFFHLSSWQSVIQSAFGHRLYFLYALVNGQIEGVLPLGHIQSWLFGKSLTSLPFAVYGGVLARNSDVALALEKKAQQLALQLHVDHLELRNVHKRHSDWPVQDLYVTFRKEILSSEEANLLAIPRKQRAMVRKGIKNGLQAKVEQTVDQFFNLYADNVHRHGTPAMPKKYFQALKDAFGENCEVLVVFGPDGKALSAVMSFYFREEVLPYYAGDDLGARELAANDFKYWELLRRACERGLMVFDFGRSKQGTGSYAFKKNWGFEPTQLHYEYCLYKHEKVPQNNPSNAKYQLLIKAWRRLPIGVANWLGPFLVRSLG